MTKVTNLSPNKRSRCYSTALLMSAEHFQKSLYLCRYKLITAIESKRFLLKIKKLSFIQDT